jgi:rubrerythrin
MGPVEALELALGKEKEAIEIYQRFLTQFPTARDVFQFLLNEEQKHKLLIEKTISRLRSE